MEVFLVLGVLVVDLLGMEEEVDIKIEVVVFEEWVFMLDEFFLFVGVEELVDFREFFEELGLS